MFVVATITGKASAEDLAALCVTCVRQQQGYLRQSTPPAHMATVHGLCGTVYGLCGKHQASL